MGAEVAFQREVKGAGPLPPPSTGRSLGASELLREGGRTLTEGPRAGLGEG